MALSATLGSMSVMVIFRQLRGNERRNYVPKLLVDSEPFIPVVTIQLIWEI